MEERVPTRYSWEPVVQGELLTNHHGVEAEAMESMEMAPGVNPRPGRVPKHEIVTPKTCLEDGGGDGTFRGWRLDLLGFLRRRLYIGGRARSVAAWVAHTMPLRGPTLGRAMGWCGRPVASFRLSSIIWLRYGKILISAFVSSNSENFSCTTFLKYKNIKKHELTLWHLVNRLVPENV
jgi:hypothetical protein